MNRFLGLIRKLIILSLLLCTVAVLGVLYYIEYELPDIEALNTVQLQVPLQIFTHDKKLLATFGEKRRIPLPYREIPQPLIQAVLATEDQRYFKHKGVDIQGLGRAAVQLVLTGKKLQGGSTITMQVARSFYLSRNKTFGRKLREILLAIKIENKLKKEKILELYLNKVFLGNRAYGVEAAAEIYYGKHLNELSIDQYAVLAGLPKAPSTLNPLANPQAALKRRNHVLGRMHEQEYIDDKTYEAALKMPLDASYHDLRTEVKAPYVAELVRAQLEQMYGDSIYTDGFRVYTTVDSKLQDLANLSVRDNLLAYDQRHGYRGPVANFGSPELDRVDAWQIKLRRIPQISNLTPAVVFEITPRSITVMNDNGDFIIIPWEGLAWARKQVSPDYLGPKPHSPQQVVALGDVVYIQPQQNNGYQLAQLPKAEAGLVALNPQNGAILAMMGGFDYNHSKFNRITNAERQPGSSFKPFIYSAALERGYTLATVINDAPLVIENPNDNSLWRPQNVNHKFYGPTRLRTAIIESRNLVSIRLLALMGVPYAIHYLKRFGFAPSQLPPGLSLALGTALVTPLQMAQAFAVFANGGMKVVPYIIDTIQNSQEEIIYQAKPLVACQNDCGNDVVPAQRVISPQNAFLITSTLHDVIQRGTAKLAKNLGRNDLAGKTGTTQNQVDAWFAGYNPDIVAISWMGFDQPQSLHEYGAQAALPMWMQFIQEALKGKPDRPLLQPEGVVSVRIDPLSGRRATANDTVAQFEYFMLPFLPDKDDTDDLSYSDQDNQENVDSPPDVESIY
ncbi:MAG: penicillin-binding protein 1A [Gammaproteobacteria bacterium]|nr:penicillin-binding protein 1A [Gammaproteobacteria bacterium]